MSLDDIILFAQAHRADDPMRLLLHQEQHPGVAMRAVAQQIEGLRQAPAKWPFLAACPDVAYPPTLNREQSSSEATARYKATLVADSPLAGADLTGGMGVDSYFLAQKSPQWHYCEQDAHLCRLAEHNFAALGCHNITVHQCDSIQWLRSVYPQQFSCLYIDPARRDVHGQRVVAFEHCTPNILECLPLLRRSASRLMVKASPMLNVREAARQLGDDVEVHILAVAGECRELLFLTGAAVPRTVCVNLRANGQDRHAFTADEEQHAPCRIATEVQQYLYEPHAALMKGGCYRLVAQWYDVAMLDANSHLYTSAELVADFPGRTFAVETAVSPTAKAVRPLLPDGKAHVICRNYPLRADLLQKQLGLREGGDRHLIATTHAGKRRAFVCRLLRSASL